MTVTVESEVQYEWPGWSLADNPYGKEFDLEARKRMVVGSKMLLPLLHKYENQLGTKILEVGPFFTPLITRPEFPDAEITYWDNDAYALEWLKNLDGTVKDINLDDVVQISNDVEAFDSIVASQILNYVDCAMLCKELYKKINPGGLLFINNVNEYGLPTLFSDKRPKSIEDVKQVLIETSFKIVDDTVIPSLDQEHQREPRFLLVAQK